MKLTSKILFFIFLVLIVGLLSSNMILKKQYDALDKTDVYWTYNKVLEQPFKYLNITGGNGTNIYYEQSAKSSVRILQEWQTYHGGNIKAVVKNDTLFINFDFVPANSFEKFWLQNASPVRIFSPELLSITGKNTNFEMQKLNQKTVTVNMQGKSKFEVESIEPNMDSVNVTESDSCDVVFEMSPDYKKPTTDNKPEGKVEFHNVAGVAVEYPNSKQNAFNESMSIRSVTASLKGHSIFDVGHAQIQKLQLQIADSSAIALSGNALNTINK